MQHMVSLHSMMVSMGATPRQFFAFVDLYGRIYTNKRKEVCAHGRGLKGVLVGVVTSGRWQ